MIWAREMHIYGFRAAFQPQNGAVFASQRLPFVQKEAPREKKALSFFHADIPFFNEGALYKQEGVLTVC